MTKQLLGTESHKAVPASSLPLYDSLETSGVITPGSLLQREYPVATVAWSPGAPMGTVLSSISFPNDLFTSYVRSKLSGFRYFRCDGIKVRVQMAGNPLTYGALMVAYDAATGYDAMAENALDIVSQSGFPHILMSAGTADSHEFTIPYLLPDARIDLSRYVPDCIGSVDILVAAPLTYAMSASTVPAYFTVYAQFINPQAECPSTCVMAAPTSPSTTQGSTVVFEY